MNEIEESGLPRVEFDQLANLFVELGVFSSPAELHGLLCGALTAEPGMDEGQWLQLAATFLEQQELGFIEVKTELLNLFASTQAELAGTGFDLDLLVPDDDAPMADRADSLAAWCRGFISGVRSFAKGQDGFSAEVKETLADLTNIAQLDTDLDESDDNEADLMELSEYVRMAAIMVFTELNTEAEERMKPSQVRRPLPINTHPCCLLTRRCQHP